MRCDLVLVLTLIMASPLVAQQAIQQPVVGTTSVNTTVSVPDRGSMFLGGVSSAQSGRSQYGPVPVGPSSGLSRQGSSVSVHVYIHDLQGMDEEILNSAPVLSEGRQIGPGAASYKQNSNPVTDVVASPVAKAAKFEQLAKKAEEAGKPGVAKLHWQMAAKYGSVAAGDRLAKLAQPVVSQQTQSVVPRQTQTVAR